MLSLISPTDAAFIVYCLENKEDWQSAFNPEFRKRAYESGTNRLSVFQVYIQNAIAAEELPAMRKAKGKPADKELFNRLAIPEDMLNVMPVYDYWITQEDFFVFLERAPNISKNYAHGRDALARLLCALIDRDKLNEQDINEHLAHKIETAETSLNLNLKLRENTLKGCCKEILDTLSTIKANDSKNS